ncbi:MAG: hypothetical protein KDD82_07400 [Planctomycetes bacterium]|nr:hypothetical protein [Planctomycetota bacterium]
MPVHTQHPERVRFRCPQCSTKFKVRAEHAGRLVRCAECEQKVRVPAPETTRSPVEHAPRREHSPHEDDPAFAVLGVEVPEWVNFTAHLIGLGLGLTCMILGGIAGGPVGMIRSSVPLLGLGLIFVLYLDRRGLL